MTDWRNAWIGGVIFLTACGGGNDAPVNDPAVTTSSPESAAPSVTSDTKSEAVSLPPLGVAADATIAHNQAFSERLPLADQADFERARRGLIATLEDATISGAGGKVAWRVDEYEFLNGGAPDTVNPSLWRHAQLNAIHGLFEVVDGIYQVRGYDISNLTVIRGETGWILVDPLLAKETASAALALVREHLGDRPVTGVLFTHSHADHFGGVRGVLSDDEISSGSVPIIAPVTFAESTVSENVIAGNAMTRRATYQFGNRLPASPTGKVDSGIGKALSNGIVGFAEPTQVIEKSGQKLAIDGVEFEFINANDTEAPAEFMFYLPQFRALHTAEVATATIHNILTPRGALIRDGLAWSKRIDDALRMFGDRADIVLASHNWPRWGNDEVRDYLANQRDVYRWIHDQTLRLANAGYTLHEIPAMISEPAFMREDFATRGYYGSVMTNSKATYQRYFGWWDGVPANLNPHPPQAQAERYVDLAGGPENMLKQAARAFDNGDFRWAATLMNHLVFAQPDNRDARHMLAAAYEQLGYQSESAIIRNVYLSGALELVEDLNFDQDINLANSDFIQAVPTSQYFDALAVRVNPEKASAGFNINFVFSDTNEKIGVQIKDGVASQISNGHLKGSVATISLRRSDLDEITLGAASFQSKLGDGSIVVDGDVDRFVGFLQAHDQPDRWFNIVTP